MSNNVASDVVRFYPQKLPEIDELVKVQIMRLADAGAYVSLLEYGNMEGMIQHTEYSKRRVRSLVKLVKVGRIENVVVLRVDYERGYVDLSRKRVLTEEVPAAEERFQKAKAVQTLLRTVSSKTGKPLSELMETIAWPLATEVAKHNYHCYDILRSAKSLESIATFLKETKNVEESVIECFVQTVGSKIIDRINLAYDVRLDLNITCLTHIDGVGVIKKGLRECLEYLSAEVIDSKSIAIRLVSSPVYSITFQTRNSSDDVIAEIVKIIQNTGCDVSIASKEITGGSNEMKVQQDN